MLRKNRNILIILFLILLNIAGAEMRLSLREENGRTVLERNSEYRVFLQVAPQGQTSIGAIGEIYLQYNTNIFTPISAFDIDYHGLPSSIWESEKISFNHTYVTSPNHRCIEYAKTDNNGPYWTISSTSNIYVLRLRVKANAPTGNTSISFIYQSNNSRTKMIKNDGSVIPLSVKNLNLVIDLDNTSPTTQINYPGGVYNAPPLVKLKPNEDARVHYLVIGGANIWEDQVVSANIWTNTIAIPYQANQVKYSTIQFYSEDFAQNKNHNEESTKAYVFTIDQEKPVISNVQVPSETIPIGGIAEVYFDLYDQVGLGQVNVSIGGQPAYHYSGAGNGTYIYRRSIDGTENPSGTLSITVSDTAGNTASNETKKVLLDFNGPQFINITTDPVSAQIQQEVIISFLASEPLRENPLVKVGDQLAHYISRDNLNYHYSYTVTANGWYIDLNFLPDTNCPFTERNLPRKYISNRPINSDVYFRVGDNQSSININNALIYVNGVNIFFSNGFINGYSGRIFNYDGRPNFVCVPPKNANPFSQTTVNIRIADTAGNVLNETYYYFTNSSIDHLPPNVVNTFPTKNAADAEPNTPVYFEIIDHDGCGLAIDRLNLTLVETATINIAPEIRKYLSASAPGNSAGVTVSQVLTNGVFQPGFHGSVLADINGDLRISIVPETEFRSGSTVTCLASFEDLAITPNATSENWKFSIKRSTATNTAITRKPLAWPAIYNPLNEEGSKLLLTFSLAEAGDIKLRIYDLSGDMIWEKEYPAEAGYQVVPWDGKDARGKYVGNGVYIWYITKSNKVIGRGTAIIMK